MTDEELADLVAKRRDILQRSSLKLLGNMTPEEREWADARSAEFFRLGKAITAELLERGVPVTIGKHTLYLTRDMLNFAAIDETAIGPHTAKIALQGMLHRYPDPGPKPVIRNEESMARLRAAVESRRRLAGSR